MDNPKSCKAVGRNKKSDKSIRTRQVNGPYSTRSLRIKLEKIESKDKSSTTKK